MKNPHVLPCRRGAVLSLLALLILLAFSVEAAPADTAPAITLPEAVAAALEKHPELGGLTHEIRAAEARRLQVLLRPNPEAEVEIENVDGDRPGLSRSETTLGVSQRLEIGGKRPARVRRAEAEAAVLGRDYRGLRLDVIAGVKRAFVALLGAQKRLELIREGREIAVRLAETAAAQVAAGAVSPIEETRAAVAAAVALADLVRAEREVEEARRELAAAIGLPQPASPYAAGELSEDMAVPPLDGLAARLRDNPDLSRWALEEDRRRASLAAERTLAVPDVTLSGGFRYLREEKENTFVLGLSIPLPLFNRNQGGIREAEALLSKTEQERRAAEVRLAAQLAQRHAALAAAAREAGVLRERALAGAQAVYDAVDEGYRLGKFRYLDVLDAGKALVEARMRHAEALVALNLARIDIERLTDGATDRAGAAPAEGR